MIAALGVAVRLNLPLHVVGLAPCAENLPQRPHPEARDVFTGMTGKTTEVISTDAEGRMLLADAPAYATKFAPAAVVYIATLTGTQAMAFGPHAATVFRNDADLAAELLAAADASGDRLWRLPLYNEYAEAIKSQVADVKNTGGRYGGMGTRAKFIEHFTEGYPWAHVDMASMSLAEDDKPAQLKGATGYGVRLLTAFLEAWGEQKQTYPRHIETPKSRWLLRICIFPGLLLGIARTREAVVTKEALSERSCSGRACLVTAGG